MTEANFNTEYDVEKLKQKISSYKETLVTLKAGNAVEDYLTMKDEFNGFKTKIENLEGLAGKVNGKQNIQREPYEQQVEHFSVQLEQLNQTIGKLNEGLSLMMTKLRNGDNHGPTEEILPLIDDQNASNPAFQNELTNNKHTLNKSQETPFSGSHPVTPSYTELRKYMNTAKNIEEFSVDQPNTDKIGDQIDPGELESFPNFNHFPSMSRFPRHATHRSSMKFNVTNKIHVMQAATPQSFSQNKNFQHATPDTKDKLKPTVKTSDTVHATVQNKKEINVANKSDTTKRQENESLSFFKFFSKMNYFKMPKG